TVRFDASVTAGDPVTYQWDFGDGRSLPASSNNEEVSHTYQGAGTFQVRLTVRKEDSTCPDGQCIAELVRLVTIADDAAEGSCFPNDNTLCLRKNRFELKMTYDTGDETGDARIVAQQSDDSGLFWFFAPDNWEVMVKVIDGCAISGNFWVLGAATTDLGYTLTVTDTQTGDSKEYVNPVGNSAPAILDLEALPGCPSGE
ncbi:MAG: PKD domain-containing protein, partial [Acidobacteriota bacterium]